MADQAALGALAGALEGVTGEKPAATKEPSEAINVSAIQAFEDFADTALSSGTRMKALEALVKLFARR